MSLTAIAAPWSTAAKTCLMSLLPTAEACSDDRVVAAYRNRTELGDNRASGKDGLPQGLAHIESDGACVCVCVVVVVEIH